MISRCNDKNTKAWKYYGALGVTVCERWRHSFEEFYADMGERPSAQHSIDRIDVTGNYEPDNCRWATKKEQMRNRRDSVFVQTPIGRLHAHEAAEKYGIKYGTIIYRHRRGFSGYDLVKKV